jgi:ArsR family transcriptional regulator
MNMSSYNCCSPSGQEAKLAAFLASFFKLVAEKSRLKILCILRNGEHCVCELMKHLKMSQSLISHHLKDLKDAGLVTDEKRGLRVYYKLTDKGRKTSNLFFHIFPKEVWS